MSVESLTRISDCLLVDSHFTQHLLREREVDRQTDRQTDIANIQSSLLSLRSYSFSLQTVIGITSCLLLVPEKRL